jgi:hypothetical protein
MSRFIDESILHCPGRVVLLGPAGRLMTAETDGEDMDTTLHRMLAPLAAERVGACKRDTD